MIIPSILESNTKAFYEKFKTISSLKGIKPLQIDFADGELVATKTVTIADIKLPKAKFTYEAHLMVTHPKNFADYADKGFKKIIVHYEAFQSEQDLEAALEEIAKLKMIPAIAISPTTAVSVLRYYTDNISNFTLLGVTPGRQGQVMMDNTVDRLRELRDLAPSAKIEMDGGVNAKNIAELIDAGATECVVGSALLQGDIEENYKNLLAALK
jgi:ribulose-phosphate 3-epimerase